MKKKDENHEIEPTDHVLYVGLQQISFMCHLKLLSFSPRIASERKNKMMKYDQK